MACSTTVHDTVCIQANVHITPRVDVGAITTCCCGNPFLGPCRGTPAEFCDFMVSQRICVQVPLTFYANAAARPTGIVCGDPGIGSCPEEECTYTIGYFRNHSAETNALIEGAGGFIILGIGTTGLSYTVTVLNANVVLTLMTPSPPAYSGQYQILYAQLLAAKLNVLNGATCDFATAAILTADTFLSNSPPEGMPGAPDVQEPLAFFNEGYAEGCPGHCPD